MLRYDADGATGEWRIHQLAPGQQLDEPAALFKKLEESVIELEIERMTGGA